MSARELAATHAALARLYRELERLEEREVELAAASELLAQVAADKAETNRKIAELTKWLADTQSAAPVRASTVPTAERPAK